MLPDHEQMDATSADLEERHFVPDQSDIEAARAQELAKKSKLCFLIGQEK